VAAPVPGAASVGPQLVWYNVFRLYRAVASHNGRPEPSYPAGEPLMMADRDEVVVSALPLTLRIASGFNPPFAAMG
jgi:hypothetical protein